MYYYYEAFDKGGNLLKGTIESPSEEQARDLINSRGITPLLLRAAGPEKEFERKRSRRQFGRASEKMLARFSRDLSVLLKAGIAADAALQTTSAAAESGHMKRLSDHILADLKAGSTLSAALQGTGVFRADCLSLIQAAESSADYGSALQELADLLDQRVAVRSRIQAALAYPALLIVLACVSLWTVLGLLIPAVTPIFLENGLPLPGIVAAMDAAREYAFAAVSVMIVALLAVALGVALARRNPDTCAMLDRSYLLIPIVGRISELRDAGRFTRTLATLIRSGVAPLQALEAASPTVANMHKRRQLASAIAEVRSGLGIGAAMVRNSALPTVAQQMILVGEESGRLEEMLMRAAMVLEAQERARTQRILSILAPGLTILIAAMVGGIILSVVGAILSINELALQ
jgi:general secretion pathway protein F